MAESVTRFITGEITRCNIGKPRTVTPKNGGDPFQTYGLHIKGVFEDTHDEFDGYLNSRYSVPVYEGGDDPIDPNEVDGLHFYGRVLIKQFDYDSGPRYYLNAISIEERVGEDSTGGGGFKSNPFNDNPLQ